MSYRTVEIFVLACSELLQEGLCHLKIKRLLLPVRRRV